MVDLLDSEEFEFRFSCGFGLLSSSFKFTDKHRLVNNICKHFTVHGNFYITDQVEKLYMYDDIIV